MVSRPARAQARRANQLPEALGESVETGGKDPAPWSGRSVSVWPIPLGF